MEIIIISAVEERAGIAKCKVQPNFHIVSKVQTESELLINVFNAMCEINSIYDHQRQYLLSPLLPLLLSISVMFIKQQLHIAVY